MEDAVSAKAASPLLPGGRDVPFAEIEATLARLVRDGRRRRSPARALTATVVVVASPPGLAAAAEALEQLGESGGVRAILISEGAHTAPMARVTENAIAISGLAPRFLNNAVAALRLSSLPAVVWWRGGSVETLDGLAVLADRLILDVPDPDDAWARASALLDRTAVTDLRWTALTRWRAALAHLFDLPEVVRGAGALDRLDIQAKDVAAARLFAGWLRSRLRWTGRASIAIAAVKSEAASPLVRVALSGGDLSIVLAVKPNLACLEASVDRAEATTRVVPLGDGTLASLIAEELGVRTRDLAFEQALASAREIHA
jgi:glucose-6-phosphate dehydrogenase assembly protein OpcA